MRQITGKVSWLSLAICLVAPLWAKGRIDVCALRVSSPNPSHIYGAFDWQVSPSTANSMLSFLPIRRVKYFGDSRKDTLLAFDSLYGPGNWDIAYLYREKWISVDDALALYEESYRRFFEENPAELQSLLATASNVYDNAFSNVRSGTDYGIQESSSTHIQDISIRRIVEAQHLRFQGPRLTQIRGRSSDLPRLGPGKIPFADIEGIFSPRIFRARWVRIGTIEDFWQNNKFLIVRYSSELDQLQLSRIHQISRAPQLSPQAMEWLAFYLMRPSNDLDSQWNVAASQYVSQLTSRETLIVDLARLLGPASQRFAIEAQQGFLDSAMARLEFLCKGDLNWTRIMSNIKRHGDPRVIALMQSIRRKT